MLNTTSGDGEERSSQGEKARGSRFILKCAAAATIASLTAFSLLPLRPHATLHGTPGHTVLHIASFGFAAALISFLTSSRARIWIGAMGLCFLALAIEAGQCVAFHQQMEWADVLLDCLGTLIAFALIRPGRARSRTAA